MAQLLSKWFVWTALLAALTACGASPDEPPMDPGSELPPPAEGFQITTPTIELAPGREATYCYYFRMPNSGAVGVKRWESQMTPGSHHMILYFTSQELQPAGTITTTGCGGGFGVWTYSAQEPHVTFDMPADIGMSVSGGQPAFIQMHYLNASDRPLQAHVTLNVSTYAAQETYTPAAAFVTYSTNINIPAGTPANPGVGTAGGICSVPAGVKFFTMSTHAHKQAVRTQIFDGASMLFQATDWEHPGARVYSQAEYYTFTSGGLNYRCEYRNPTSRVIQDGDSAVTDEMCMAIGYFFPATRSLFCLNNTVVPL